MPNKLNFTPRVKGPVSPEVRKNFACAISINQPRGQWGEVGSCKRGTNNARIEDLADNTPAASTSGELNDTSCRAPCLLVPSGVGPSNEIARAAYPLLTRLDVARVL